MHLETELDLEAPSHILRIDGEKTEFGRRLNERLSINARWPPSEVTGATRSPTDDVSKPPNASQNGDRSVTVTHHQCTTLFAAAVTSSSTTTSPCHPFAAPFRNMSFLPRQPWAALTFLAFGVTRVSASDIMLDSVARQRGC